MKRLISFKAIRKDTLDWIEGSYIEQIDETKGLDPIRTIPKIYDNVLFSYEVFRETVCQYTGKLITTTPPVMVFVGDIVEVMGTKKVGLYSTIVVETQFGFSLEENKTYLNDQSCLIAVSRVTGNIHDAKTVPPHFKFDIRRPDFYKNINISFNNLTRMRLIDMAEIGLEEIEKGEFGIPNFARGFFIEDVWNIKSDIYHEKIKYMKNLILKRKQ